MSQGFGQEMPGRHVQGLHRQAGRYLILISSGGFAVARLFTDSREQVAEFDASTEETAVMTKGQAPVSGASGPEWDKALAGHSAAERAAAEVYTLEI